MSEGDQGMYLECHIVLPLQYFKINTLIILSVLCFFQLENRFYS